MKGKIKLSEKIDEVLEKLDLNYSIKQDDVFDYEISIYIDESDKYGDIINKTDALANNIKSSIDFCKTIDKNDKIAESMIEFYSNISNKELELLNNAVYVEINFPIDKIISYIKKNPILKNKKIILDGLIIQDNESFELIKKELGDIIDNIYFSIVGNDNVVNYKDCLNTFKTIDDLVNKINKYNFSPLEKIMYVYDLVRDKVYAEEDKDDNYTASRDLSNALLGDKIVCVGYAKVFYELLDKLNIKSYLYNLKDKNDISGHTRNVIYIKDDKYNIDGVYFFDSTWDSKYDKDDNNYLNSYIFFAKTKEFFDKYDENNNLLSEKLNCFSWELPKIIKELLDKKEYDLILKDYLKTINSIATYSNNERIINQDLLMKLIFKNDEINSNDIYQKLIEYLYYYDREIPCETLLKVLYNVRKYQYYENPKKFLFSMNNILTIILKSKWNFNLNGIERLLYEIALEDNNRKEIINYNRNNLIKYDRKYELSKDIERVKLAKTLRRLYEKKNIK